MALILTGILSLCLIGISGAQQNVSEECILNEAPGNEPGLKPVLAKHETALLTLLGFCGFSVLLAVAYMALRRHIFHDADNLDTAFDAGGQVSLSLTAVTVASQLTWPADLLQSATVAVGAGIGGPFFYAAGVVFNLLLFPILSVKFKIRCPGAKTYLQMIHARYGKLAHLQYTVLALMVNIMVLACLTTSSKATIQAFTKDASDEFVVFIMATLFGSYAFIGGLGSTFYVSYFNAVLLTVSIAIIVFKVFFSTTTEYLGLGDINKMYDTLACLQAPEGNYENSYLTFRAKFSILWGVIAIFIMNALMFCDQAAWQSRIAAKPNDGVWGFILATAIYFAIPTTIGTTSGLAYLVMSSQNDTHLLSQVEVDTGLVTPLVVQKIFGEGGAYLMLTMSTMALMATGSGEVMAISSILVYDIYQIHIKPFRKGLENWMCIICGRILRDMTQLDPKSIPLSIVNDSGTEPTTPFCTCPSVHNCRTCNHGDSNDTVRSCTTHGALRQYQAQLLSYKSWGILWVTLGLVPFGLLVLISGISLNWTLLYGAVLVTSSYPGVLLSILWARTTREGLIFGGLLSLVGSICVNLGVASTYEGGIDGVDNFFLNTVQLESVVAGAATCTGLGFLSIILISLSTGKVRTSKDAELEWEKTRNIDNPLSPWADRFQEDFPDLQPGQRPTNDQMERNCRSAKLSAYIGAGICLVVFIIVVPGIMCSFPILTFDQFQGWVYSGIAWLFVMVIMVIVIAPLQEGVQIYRRYQRNKESTRL